MNGLRPDARLGTEDLYVRWRKGSIDSVYTLARDEVSVLRKLKPISESPFAFVSERGSALSADMIARIVEWAAERHGRRIIRRDISSSLARA